MLKPLCLSLCSALLFAQPTIETIAGGFVPDRGPARMAPLGAPSGVAADASGNVYFASTHYHAVFRVSPSGELSRVAGKGTAGFSGDGGRAVDAELQFPLGVAVDAAGNLFIVDAGNHVIRRVSAADGSITRFAGIGEWGFAGDGGPANQANLANPSHAALDAAGNLYIADSDNHRIRKVDAQTGVITTIAGSQAEPAFGGDNGPAIEAKLANPRGVAADSFGNLYIADGNNNRIRKVVLASGIITTYAGTGEDAFSGDDGPAVAATMGPPLHMAVDSNGDLYFADAFYQRVRRITRATGIISTVVGDGAYGDAGDGGPAVAAGLAFPLGVAVGSGNLYVTSYERARVRRVVLSTGIIDTIAGNGEFSYAGDGGSAVSSGLALPRGLAVDSAGNIFIADSSNQRIRRVDGNSGVITTVAGNGSLSYGGDGGLAPRAELGLPAGVAVDFAGFLAPSAANLFIGDTYNDRVRRVVLASGIIETLAGTGETGISGDGGLGVGARFNGPTSLAYDGRGNLFIADSQNHRIRRLNLSTGIIETVAGTGEMGFGGDGGPAVRAKLATPEGIALDGSGNLYIADAENHRVRRIVLATGVISTVAGTEPGFGGDGGPATQAQLNLPRGVAVDGSGTIYIADSDNHRIRRIRPNGIIDTIAGSNSPGFRGDGGPASNAQLLGPAGLAVDPQGRLLIADTGNQRVRRITFTTPTTQWSASPSSLTFTASSAEQTVALTTSGGSLSFTTSIPSDAAWLRVAPATGSIPGTLRISVNTAGLASGTYTAPLRITAGNVTREIRATLVINPQSAPLLSVPESALTFHHQTGGAAPAAQALLVESTGSAVSFKVSATPNWIVVSPVEGTTPQTISISANPGSLPPGAYSGTVLIAAGAAQNSPRRIPVYFTIAGGASPVSILPERLFFQHRLGRERPEPKSIFVVSNNGEPLQVQARPTILSPRNASWLTVEPPDGQTPRAFQIIANPTGLTRGTYEGSIGIHIAGASQPVASIPVVMEVLPAANVSVGTAQSSVSLLAPAGSGPQASQITVINQGTDSMPFTVSVAGPAAAWINVPVQQGSANAGSASTVVVNANPQGLAPGVYSGNVVIQAPGQPPVEVPVVLAATQQPRALVLSQSGLSYRTGPGSARPRPQSISVLIAGRGEARFTARAESQPAGWLSVTPASGTASPQPIDINVEVNAQGLPAGEYYGRVIVESADVDNSPLIATVVLRVQTNDPGPYAEPTGVTFVADANGAQPEPRTISLVMPAARGGDAFSASTLLDPGTPAEVPNWLNLSATRGTINAETKLASITVQPSIAGLAPGVYRGTVTVVFPGNVPRFVSVLLVVSPSGAANDGSRGAVGCVPTRYLPLFTSLEESFSIPAGGVARTDMVIVDNCGAPLVNGSAAGTLSNGDRPYDLAPLGSGRWQATWIARQPGNDAVAVNITAADSAQNLEPGRAPVTGFIQGSLRAPVLQTRDPIVAADGLQPQLAVAPGSLIRIRGRQLANESLQASGDGQTELGSARVLLGSRPLLLRAVSPEQIVALVPAGVPVNTRLPLVVFNGAVSSAPEPVIVARSWPLVLSSVDLGHGRVMLEVSGVGEDLSELRASGAIIESAAQLRPGVHRIVLRDASRRFRLGTRTAWTSDQAVP